MTNREVILSRLKANGSMSGLDLVKVGKEKAYGLLETVKTMVESGEIVKTSRGLYTLPKSQSFTIVADQRPSQEEFAQMVRGYPNWMIAIGYTSYFRCYLNLELEEAIKRYEKATDEKVEESATINVVVFHDELAAYQIWDGE